jgi:hypothetical protein
MFSHSNPSFLYLELGQGIGQMPDAFGYNVILHFHDDRYRLVGKKPEQVPAGSILGRNKMSHVSCRKHPEISQAGTGPCRAPNLCDQKHGKI